VSNLVTKVKDRIIMFYTCRDPNHCKCNGKTSGWVNVGGVCV